MSESDERKRSSAGWWIASTLFVLLLVAYPLSYGPVFRLSLQGRIPGAILVVYRPLDVAFEHSPEAVQRAYHEYFDWWVADVWPGVPGVPFIN